MLCFSVDNPDSLENVESKWVGEILENCPGVELVLVALKCDLRPAPGEEEEVGTAVGAEGEPKRGTLTYQQGLDVAKKIQALRYLGKFIRGRGIDVSCVVYDVCMVENALTRSMKQNAQQ